jgi:hypothetical protein
MLLDLAFVDDPLCCYFGSDALFCHLKPGTGFIRFVPKVS